MRVNVLLFLSAMLVGCGGRLVQFALESSGGDGGLDGGNLDPCADPCSCILLPVRLGGSAQFGSLAGSTITSTGPTHIVGDIGTSPGTAIVGFPPGTVTGTIHS